MRAYEQAAHDFEHWPGARTPALELAHADLLDAWGTWLWARDPAAGAERLIDAAKLARPLLRADAGTVPSTALAHGANGALALWSRGRRAEALELSRAFSEEGEAVCARSDPTSQASCLRARAAYHQQLAWAGDPRAAGLLEDVRRRQAAALANDPDSTTVLHDAMWVAFEQGDFEGASRLAAQLRGRHSSDEVSLGELATVLAGLAAPLPPGAPVQPPSNGTEALARALQLAASARFGEAARLLRDLDPAAYWYEAAWTPRPQPALMLPARAQPSFKRFLYDFTRAFGQADMAALGASLDALADTFEALEPAADGGRSPP